MITVPGLSDHEDREQIARALDDTLVVEAAAGTGKTTELVRRIVRVIETGRAEVTEIIAVTFTEKAAGELKLRLRETLEAARENAAAGSDHRDRLDEALSRLEEAQVSTIHGFCADLLRERPVEAGVDPLFTVLTEAQASRVFNAAFHMWLQEQLVDPPEGIKRSLRRPAFAGFGSTRDLADGPVDRLRNAGFELTKWRDFDGSWQRAPFDRTARMTALVEQLHAFVELSSQPAYANDNLYQDTRPARQLSEEIRRTAAVAPRDDSRLEAALLELSRNRQFQRARKGSGTIYRPGVTREDVWRAREDLQSALGRFEADANADLAVLLHRELRGCVIRYREAKAKTGAVDFLDLLLRARDLIRDNAEVRHAFQRRFKRIFVDEFQDTDPLQAEILLLLAADNPSTTEWRQVVPVPGKLFIVGDPKQSIYRFRRADVAIYRTVYDMLQAAGARRLTLRTSFRARPNIQRVINSAFAPAMRGAAENARTERDAALQAGYVPLEPFRPDSVDQPSVVVLPVPRPYATQRIANTAIEHSLPDAVGAFVDWLVRESGWMVAERPSGASPGWMIAERPSSPVVSGPSTVRPEPFDSVRAEPVEAQSVAQDELVEGRTLGAGFSRTGNEQLVPIQARHICLLFRRFISYEDDMTRPYVEALEARGIPHLLVGGRSFHNRAEIETLRTSLAAIEWPDDELSVFATLRGSLFAIGEEELLQYRHRVGHFHPFRIPNERVPVVSDLSRTELTRFEPIARALLLLQSLHRSRNRVPVATTISRLLEATRAHVRFALEHGGEQVLANVLHVAELARRYEAEGGISFRGFIEELREQAEAGEAAEAPILEEGSDGVRLMTVHKAKGLEFPVVILADITAKLRASTASRFIDPDRQLCALRLAGCSPIDLLQHEAEELLRDDAEGVRVAYVAATRARDLLVVPAVGDEPREGWIEPLNAAIYPSGEVRRQQIRAPACPAFRTRDSVLVRPGGDPAGPDTVSPGLHVFGNVAKTVGLQSDEPSEPDLTYSVVWWDPRALELDAESPLGIRRSELIVRDVAPSIVEAGMAEYRSWRGRREAAISTGSQPSIALQTVTAWARTSADQPERRSTTLELPEVEIIQLPGPDNRPSGARFGTLIHIVLASVPLGADADVIRRLTTMQARTLSATQHEVNSAAETVQTVLMHPLLQRAREADKASRCRREVPIAWRHGDAALIEGVIDLAFEEGSGWIVVDFKTEDELRTSAVAYERQVRMYAAALRVATARPVWAALVHV